MNPYIITLLIISQQNYNAAHSKTHEFIKPDIKHKAVLAPIREQTVTRKK
jgi:hypothetical protein